MSESVLSVSVFNPTKDVIDAIIMDLNKNQKTMQVPPGCTLVVHTTVTVNDPAQVVE